MYYSELINEINNLKEMMVIVDGNLKHNINVFWAALAIGLTLVGLISVGWLRYFVAEEVQKKLKDEVSKTLKDYSKIHEVIIPTLINGWRGSNIHYYKDENEYVVLEGVVYGGVVDHPVMGFPTTYRPLEELKVPVICTEGTGYCIIGIDGFVTIHAHSRAMVRFGGIKFKTK